MPQLKIQFTLRPHIPVRQAAHQENKITISEDVPAAPSCRPRWKIYKSAQVRTNRLEITIVRQQRQSVFPAGQGNQHVIDQRARPLLERHTILTKKSRENAATFLEGG